MFGIFKAMRELKREQELFRHECAKAEHNFKVRENQFRLIEDKNRSLHNQDKKILNEMKLELNNKEEKLNHRYALMTAELHLFATRLASAKLSIELLEKELDIEKDKVFKRNNIIAELKEMNLKMEKALEVSKSTLESISKDNKDETISKLQDRIHTLEVEIARLTPCKGVLS